MCVDVVQNPKIAAVTIEVLAGPASRILGVECCKFSDKEL